MNNKVWFITGISSGLGKALAEAVMATGDFVIGTFRKQAQVDAFNEKFATTAHAVLLDITNEEAIATAIAQVISKYKRIDVLVNNAGMGFVGAIEETAMTEVRRVFEANFFGTLKVTQTVLPYMRKADNGHIVQISSHGGIKAFAGFGIYNASKFALEGFSEALQQEVAPLGIKVSIIEPGPFRTQFAVIGDYAGTAGAFREKLKSVHGKQEGDPIKASKAIIDFVDAKTDSLRLPLGKVPLVTIGMKLDSVRKDLESNRTIAKAVVY